MAFAKYLRLLCHSSHPGGGGYYRVGDIEVRQISSIVNQCMGGTAFGNSDYFPASRAFDGSILNASNVWAGNPGDGRTIGYNFSSFSSIDIVRVRNSDTASTAEQAQHLRTFDIQVSDDGTVWTTMMSVTNHPSTQSASVDYTLPGYIVSGVVLDSAGLPCARPVRMYRRDTGFITGSTISNSTTGEYSMLAPSGEQTLVFLPNSGESLNALVLDRIVGV